MSQTHKATTVPEDSPEAAAATPPSTDGVPGGPLECAGVEVAPKREDLTAVELPANTTPTHAKVRGFQLPPRSLPPRVMPVKVPIPRP